MTDSFSISPTLNKNKIFLLQKSELVDRWDPLMILYQSENQSFKYETKKLKNLLVSNPEYGAGEIGIERKTKTEPRYIRITDIDEFGLLSSDLGVTANTIEAKYFLNDNDFLFARSGATVGKAYLHKKDLVPYPCFYAGYMIRYRLNEKEILPEYLFAITQTRFYKNWVKAIQRPTGQPNINAEEFKSLSFPLPPKEIQQKVVNIFSKAYEHKKQNEAQSGKILASIDDYLLKELGITLPIPPENILKNRIFTSQLSELSGNRFDPAFHQIYFHQLVEAIENSKFSKTKLGDHLSEISYGASFNNFYVDTGVPLLRIKDLKRNEISVDEVVYLPESARTQLGNCFVKTNDFLITRSGTIGLVAIVPKEIDGFAFGSFMIKFNLKDTAKVHREYLSYFLNCGLIAKLVERNKIGAIQGNITIPIIKSLPLVIPPLAKQKEIAEHITDIRKQAQQLKNKTNEAMKKASNEIERILLN